MINSVNSPKITLVFSHNTIFSTKVYMVLVDGKTSFIYIEKSWCGREHELYQWARDHGLVSIKTVCYPHIDSKHFQTLEEAKEAVSYYFKIKKNFPN